MKFTDKFSLYETRWFHVKGKYNVVSLFTICGLRVFIESTKYIKNSKTYKGLVSLISRTL